MSEAICTWPSCGHTAKGQCGLRLVFDPVTRSAVRINPPPDLPPTVTAELIAARKRIASLEDALVGIKRAARARMLSYGDEHSYYYHTAHAAMGATP